MSAIVLDAQVRAEVAAMLRRAFSPFAPKISARYADASHRTTERWVRGTAIPPATAILRMARHAGFRAELRAWCDRCEAEENAINDSLDRLDATRTPLARAILERARARGDEPGGAEPAADRGSSVLNASAPA